MFDALKHVDELKQAGFTEKQARAQLRLVQESTEHTSATKTDLLETENRLKTDLLETENRLKTDLLKTENRLKTDLLEMQARLEKSIAEVRTELKGTENKLLMWLFGIALTQTAVLLGVMALLHR